MRGDIRNVEITKGIVLCGYQIVTAWFLLRFVRFPTISSRITTTKQQFQIHYPHEHQPFHCEHLDC